MSEQNTEQSQDERFAEMKRRAKEVKEKGRALMANGHKCVAYLESYPPKLVWCGNQQCSKTQ